jgi:YihY family inner membrane protein
VELVDRVADGADSWQQRHTPVAFVFGVIKKFGEDQGGHLAALMTYYGFLSIFPLLLVFVTTLGFFLHDNPSLRHDLLNSALADFPIIGAQLQKIVPALGGNGIGLFVGIVGLVWGSLGVAQVAQHTMAEVWNIPIKERPNFFARLGRSLLILAVLSFAIVATTVLASVATLVPASAVTMVFTMLGTVAVNVGLYLLAFRVLTPKVIATRDLWPGALVGGVAWTALQTAGGWLVARQLRHTSELYGFFGIVLGLLLFLFLASQITVYAAEVNVVRARRLWPRSLRPPPLTQADERALTDRALAEERRPEEHVGVAFDTAAQDR